jgi:hypothetical protein
MPPITCPHLSIGNCKVTCRRRRELTDVVLLSLCESSWNILDLSSCVHLQQSSILKALEPLAQLRMLDLSGCRLTNQVIFALPQSTPKLQLLRLHQCNGPVERAAWLSLVPVVLPGRIAESWEDDLDPVRCAPFNSWSYQCPDALVQSRLNSITRVYR